MTIQLEPQEVTVGTSICWRLGRDRFEKRIREKEKIPEDQQTDCLKKFFKKYPLDQAFNSCEEIKSLAADKYGGEERQNKIGSLLETLNTFKDAVDGLLSCAPESVSAIWLGLGMIIKIVSDDLLTCRIIVDAFDSIVTITLFSLLVEKRYLQSVHRDPRVAQCQSIEQKTFEKVQDLVCAIFDFSWHTQYHLSPQWDKETSNSTPHTHGLSEKLKSGVAKTGHKIKTSAKTVGAKFREAIIGDIKSKHEEIEGLYGEIQNLCHVLFQEATLTHNQDMGDKLNDLLRETEGRISQRVQQVQDSIKECTETVIESIETSTQKIGEGIKEGNEKVIEVLGAQLQDATKAIFDNLNAAPKSPHDALDRYHEILQPSSALDNFLLGLKNRKDADGALTKQSWILENSTYQEWRDKSREREVLCLTGRKGHGKTMTMLSVHDNLVDCHIDPEKEVVLRFFFKLGDTELQSSLRAFESLILQLLEAVKGRDNARPLLNDIIGFKTIEDIEKYKKASNQGKCDSIRDYINKIASKLGLRVYMILDAIDECQDRSESGLLQHLQNLVLAEDSCVQVLISVREEIDIEKEIVRGGITAFRMLALVPKDTEKEMDTFLQSKLKEIILTRVNNQNNIADIRAETERYLPSLQRKVEGDFAYANMIVANLREPSRMTLETRIAKLPSSVEEIYRRSLEGMKASERLLIIFALRWVAWSFSDITALEIAEHYRGVYRDPERDPEAYGVYDFSDLSKDPEIRETINHLRVVGRDFFTFVEETEPITVHLSVREWVKKPLNLEKALPSGEMQAKVLNSIGGNFVFEVQIPAANIPTGHHELSELFNAEESHLAIVLDCLRALTNPNFQYRHEPWDPPEDSIIKWETYCKDQGFLLPTDPHLREKLGDLPLSPKPRYEILETMKHLLALEEFYSPQKVLNNPNWIALRQLFVEFTHQKRNFSWYPWNAWYSFFTSPRRRDLDDSNAGFHRQSFSGSVSPLEFLVVNGCRYLIELYCHGSGPLFESIIHQPYRIFTSSNRSNLIDLIRSISSSAGFHAVNQLSVCAAIWLNDAIEDSEFIENSESTEDSESDEYSFAAASTPDGEMSDMLRFFISNSPIRWIRSAMRTICNCILVDSHWAHQTSDKLDNFLLIPTLDKIFDILLLRNANSRLTQGGETTNALDECFAEAVRAFILRIDNNSYKLIHWKFLKFLLEKGAQLNPDTEGEALFSAIVDAFERYADPNDRRTLPLPMVLDIFEELLNMGYVTSKAAREKIFIIARVRQLKLFQKLTGGRPAVLDQVDQSGRSVMHTLFQKGEGCGMKFPDSLVPLFDEIYRIQPQLVNAQDNKSRAPLSYAVENRDLEGVELLLRNGADVHDDDELGQTALHTLCAQNNVIQGTEESDVDWSRGFDQLYRSGGSFSIRRKPKVPKYCKGKNDLVENDLLILSQLESASIDLNSRTKTLATPLAIAFQYQRPPFLLQFLNILQQRYQSSEYISSVLLSCDLDNRNILHYATSREGLRCYQEQKDLSDIVEIIFSYLDEEQRISLLNGKDLSRGFTPLHEAAKKRYLHLIGLFTRHNADVRLESEEGYPAIHYLIGERAFELAIASKCPHSTDRLSKENPSDSQAVAMKTDEDLLISLLGDIQVASQNSTLFANLQCLALQQGWTALQKVLDTRGIDPSSTDDSGWNQYHMLNVFNGTWIESQESGDFPLDVKLRPSALEYYYWCRSDGDEIDMIDSTKTLRMSKVSEAQYLADNLIPPMPSRFYFEVMLEGKSLTYGDFFRIGLMSAPFDLPQLSEHRVMTVYWASYEGIFHDNSTDPPNQVYIGPWAEESSNSYVMDPIGLGFDYPTGKIYFTKGGQLIGDIYQVVKRDRWRPGVSVTSGSEVSLTVNFGSEDFAFRNWEAPIEEIETMYAEQPKEERKAVR